MKIRFWRNIITNFLVFSHFGFEVEFVLKMLPYVHFVHVHSAQDANLMFWFAHSCLLNPPNSKMDTFLKTKKKILIAKRNVGKNSVLNFSAFKKAKYLYCNWILAWAQPELCCCILVFQKAAWRQGFSHLPNFALGK